MKKGWTITFSHREKAYESIKGKKVAKSRHEKKVLDFSRLDDLSSYNTDFKK